MRGVTVCRQRLHGLADISTHTPHARRDKEIREMRGKGDISTHTPHARRDRRQLAGAPPGIHFYSHASCEA